DSTISMACRPIEPVAPSRATRFICSKCTAGTRLSDRPSGGLGETSAVPPDRAARPDSASSVAPVVIHYRDSLRPCLRTSIAPRRRATFRQALLRHREDRVVRDDCREQMSIEAVEHSAVRGEETTAVLDVQVALDRGLEEVADRGRDRDRSAERERLSHG